LIRHAKPADGIQTLDFTRPISEEGNEIQKKMAALLKSRGFTPDFILHSPYLRTEQTAQILSDFFGIAKTKEESLALRADERELINLLPDPKENKTVCIIGHAPSLLRLANRLVGKACPIYEIEASAALILSLQDACVFGLAKFEHYITPDELG
jgi:phosphohistidine phosphatase